MTRRLVAALVVVLLAAVAVAPAALGWRAERTYTRIVERLNAANRDIEVRIDAYERGWLSSRVRYTVDLGGPSRAALRALAGDDGRLQLHGRDRIRHGAWVDGRPAIARVDSELRMAAARGTADHDARARAPILRARSVIDLGGDVHARFHVPDRRIEAGAREPGVGPVVEWQDVSGDAGLVGGVGRYTLRVRAAALRDRRGDRLVLSGLEVGQRGRRGADGVRLGDARVTFRRLELRLERPGRPLDLRLERLTAASRIDAEGDHVGITSDLAFARALVNGVELTDARLGTRLRHLRPGPLARLQARMADLRRGIDRGGELRAGDVPGAGIDAALEDLLRGSPRLQADRLRVDTPDGRISGDLRLAFDGGRRFDLDAPLTLLGPLSVRLALHAPRALVRRGLYTGMRGRLPQGEFRNDMETRLRRQVERTVELLVGAGLLDEQRGRLVLRVDKDAGGPPRVNGQDVMAVIGAVAGLMER